MKMFKLGAAFAALMLLISGVSTAATIDFESVSDGDLTPADPFSGERYFSTDGFDFSTTFGAIADSGGNQVLVANSAGQLFSPGPEIRFARSDTQAFSLLGMDVTCNACTIRGVINGGGFLDTSNVNDLGSGDWLNLSRVFVFEPGGEQGLFLSVAVDNIVVGAPVPVPAAVWLFGSALAGLVFRRRARQAVAAHG